ncbi:MAG: hypothetical protein PHT12_04525 [Patescibacteria group bacterium]|nr:hypothetical protein [Patescibacteria group bacterium]
MNLQAHSATTAATSNARPATAHPHHAHQQPLPKKECKKCHKQFTPPRKYPDAPLCWDCHKAGSTATPALSAVQMAARTAAKQRAQRETEEKNLVALMRVALACRYPYLALILMGARRVKDNGRQQVVVCGSKSYTLYL